MRLKKRSTCVIDGVETDIIIHALRDGLDKEFRLHAVRRGELVPNMDDGEMKYKSPFEFIEVGGFPELGVDEEDTPTLSPR